MRSWPIYDEHEEGDEYHRPWWRSDEPWHRRYRRSEKLLAIAIITVMFLAMWLAAALGTWATGVSG